MNSHKTTAMSRHKVPNLINIATKQKSQYIAWPKFFAKIQNSLKILQQPIPKKESKNITKDPFINYQNKISLRLKNIIQKKQRAISLPQKESKDTCRSMISNRPQTGKYQLKTQPPTNTGFRYNKNYRSLHKPSYSLHLDSSKNKQQKTNFDFQTIATTTINGTDYQELIEQKEKEQRIRMESIELESSSNENSLGGQSYLVNQKEEILEFQEGEFPDNLKGFKQISQKLIAGQPRLYEAYDRKLMQKIRIYRPKKFKFDHQPLWR